MWFTVRNDDAKFFFNYFNVYYNGKYMRYLNTFKNITIWSILLISMLSQSMERLEKLVLEIREREVLATKELQRAFPGVPDDEWQSTFDRIEGLKKLVSKDLMLEFDVLKKGENDHFLYDNRYFQYENLQGRIEQYLSMRAINEKKVKVIFNTTAPNACPIAATATYYDYNHGSLTNHEPFLTIASKSRIEKECNSIIETRLIGEGRWLGLCLHYFNRITNCETFQKDLTCKYFIDHVIHHEITHLKEMHYIKKTELLNTILKFHSSIDNHACFKIFEYDKSCEYVADLLPCILYPELAKCKLQLSTDEIAYENMIKKLKFNYILKSKQNVTHPTNRELLPYLEKIVKIHESK